MLDFVKFPKIPRLSRDMTITEKIHGCNVSVFIYNINDDKSYNYIKVFKYKESGDIEARFYDSRYKSIPIDKYQLYKRPQIKGRGKKTFKMWSME